jgi:hypothetical protein
MRLVGLVEAEPAEPMVELGLLLLGVGLICKGAAAGLRMVLPGAGGNVAPRRA